MVAPVVMTPLIAADSPNSSFSQRRLTTSAWTPSGDDAHAYAGWSSAAASRSAPSAAGVTPPTTKWKKRGPEVLAAASSPRSTSARRAAAAPMPRSGRSMSSA